MLGSPRAPVLTKSASFLVTLTCIETAQSRCDTAGVTLSSRSAGTNWVWTPLAEMTEIGIDTPDLMDASMLFEVVMRGAEMMRTVPASSAADRRRFRLTFPPTEPSERPIAPPDPRPTAAGKLTAKSDGRTRPPVGVLPASAPPPALTLLGKTRPVEFPPAADALTLPPHWMPNSRLKVDRA